MNIRKALGGFGALLFAVVVFTVVSMSFETASAHSVDASQGSTIAVALGGADGVPETHLIKTTTTRKETVPVTKEVCDWVREENPYNNGSSLVRKCVDSLGWKRITVTVVEYRQHAWPHN